MKHTIHIRTTTEELRSIHAALLSIGVLPKSHADTFRQAALLFERKHRTEIGPLSDRILPSKEQPFRYEWLTHIREAERQRAITLYEGLAEGLGLEDLMGVEDVPLVDQLKKLGVIE